MILLPYSMLEWLIIVKTKFLVLSWCKKNIMKFDEKLKQVGDRNERDEWREKRNNSLQKIVDNNEILYIYIIALKT